MIEGILLDVANQRLQEESVSDIDGGDDRSRRAQASASASSSEPSTRIEPNDPSEQSTLF
jgi:hypothetical protein